ncbi:WYL domain-containing protein [Allosphingosinicella flava]|uniref:WYL domain-containing protein n=1 Tax=Allosphingosinicella flava TaxID=2771430 RepID=A0A7T2GL38_9SPHN|nr:WYL domain-containing protein [Sphingosinicella flava]QPQ55849.1 WYL domain-containing protein [Sphingosinicella flava]
MLQELWTTIQGKGRGRAVAPLHEEDDEDIIVPELHQAPKQPLEALSGFTCIIAYRNAKGVATQRQVTCIRLEEAASTKYLRAFCHARAANRQFRLDRIEAVADLHTAEIIAEDGVSYFSRFEVTFRQESKIGWGISVSQRADLLAGMNALVFMARCDKDYHPTERDEIEKFVCSYWVREELPGDPPMEDILAHAERLSPDPEVFYGSLIRCHEHPRLAKTIRRHIQSVIEADGLLHDHEIYWGKSIDDYFRSLTG